MNESKRPDVSEVVARAVINQRCAEAYLHDIRGSMQALFSAVELLGRSAKSGGDPERLDKAYTLARRAIGNHENATLATMQLLTLQPAAVELVETGALAKTVAHLLRNYAANRNVVITAHTPAEARTVADRSRLQTLVAGLLLAAIDAITPGSCVVVTVDHDGAEGWIGIDTHCGFAAIENAESTGGFNDRGPQGPLNPNLLTLNYARHYLLGTGGRLEVDAAQAPRGALRLTYPVVG